MRAAEKASLALNTLCLGTVLSALSLGCQTAPTDLRPWKPSDHSNIGESSGAALPRPGTNANSNAGTNQVSGEPSNTTPGLEEVTIATWRANCASCHGAMGRGDGPQAVMVTPRDLSDPEWQAATSDEQLVQSIQKGKNKMPGFNLPEQVARNLVNLVRLLNRDRMGRPAAAPSTPQAASTAAQAASAPQAASAAPQAASPAAPATSAASSAIKPAASRAPSSRGRE